MAYAPMLCCFTMYVAGACTGIDFTASNHLKGAESVPLPSYHPLLAALLFAVLQSSLCSVAPRTCVTLALARVMTPNLP